MDDPRLPRVFYFLLLGTGLVNWYHYYPLLPERMASHFRFDGTPDNWQTKEAFFLTMSGVMGLTLVMSFLVPHLVAVLPTQFINLPNKEHWLSPERREETLRFFSAQMSWFGCGLLIVLLYTASAAMRANLTPGGRINNQGMLGILGGFAIFTTIWLVRFLRHFCLPGADATPKC